MLGSAYECFAMHIQELFLPMSAIGTDSLCMMSGCLQGRHAHQATDEHIRCLIHETLFHVLGSVDGKAPSSAHPKVHVEGIAMLLEQHVHLVRGLDDVRENA